MPDRYAEISAIPTLSKPREHPVHYIEQQAEFDKFVLEFPQYRQKVPTTSLESLSYSLKPALAIDTERSRGKDYQAHVELLQLKIHQEPIVLIDTQSITGIPALAPELAEFTWIAHAAEADLLALHKLGLHCTSLFDTELAGRFLGYSHVNLATMTRECLGINLAKGKGGEDWSLRPLDSELLLYAALDVELLCELAEILHAKLLQSNKLLWFHEECDYIIQHLVQVKRKFNWKKITKHSRHTNTNVKRTFTIIWHIRESIAYSLDIFPQLLASDEELLDWADVHQKIVWENFPQTELATLEFPVTLAEKISLSLPLEEDFWKKITQSTGTKPDFFDDLELIQERKKAITAVIQQIAQDYELDPILLSSRSFSIALAKNITAHTEGDIQDIMQKSGSRSWQIDILSAALSVALVNL